VADRLLGLAAHGDVADDDDDLVGRGEDQPRLEVLDREALARRVDQAGDRARVAQAGDRGLESPAQLAVGLEQLARAEIERPLQHAAVEVEPAVGGVHGVDQRPQLGGLFAEVLVELAPEERVQALSSRSAW
jgi:hypothetical protein